MLATNDLDRDGVTLLKWSPEKSLEALARGLGFSPRERRVLVPRGSGRYPSLSANHGLGKFPWHTDGAQRVRPPRWLLLRSTGEPREPTLLLNGVHLAARSEFTADLSAASWLVRGARPFYAPIVSPRENALRWNPDLMRPRGSRAPAVDVRWRRLLAEAKPIRHKWRPGEVLILDNWRWLHSRPAIAASDQERRLERVQCE